MNLKKLPLGIQTFSKIIKDDYIYIDKTDLALDIITNNQYVFLSRPRRFGKSLFLDTLHNIFEGNKELFKGLDIYDKYDFEEYPVIKIDWAGNFKTLADTKRTANHIFNENQKRLGIVCEDTSPDMCFRELIRKAHEKYKKPVVILIDEYDKPILDNMDNIQRANENRDFLRGIYIQLKANDAYLKFVFLTGVTKFSKASIFSGLNNITDISLKPKYGNICGYTQKNIEIDFKDYLVNADLEKVKKWYNGYNFLGDKVYNPYDILQFIDNDCVYKNYWWKTGNAFSLIELIKKGNYYLPSLQNLKVDKILLDSFDVEKLKIESLLFQAGYLTIDRVDIDEEFDIIEYYLRVPNKEIQLSLNKLILDYLTDKSNTTDKNMLISLRDANLEDFKSILISLFESIAHNNFRNNNISHFEGFYASVVYSYLAGSGLDIIAEDVTKRGNIDLSIKIQENIYVVEFKVTNKKEKTNIALQQIKDKKYHLKYTQENKNIYLLGIVFNEEAKNIDAFEWERIEL